MTTPARPANQRNRGYFFFLSYALSPPTLGRDESPADIWVTTFFQDLCGQVRQLAADGPNLEAGVMEEQLPLNGDWQAKVGAALGTAEVLVPLYSPVYMRRSLPRAVRDAFQSRLSAAGTGRAEGHVQPVLWIPLPPGVRPVPDDLADALSLGEGVPEYAENGLGALCRLTIFREQYGIIMRRLAQRIVDVARDQPLGASKTKLPFEVTPAAPDETTFLVGALALVNGELAPDKAPAGYADTTLGWRPFAGSEVDAVVQYTASRAEQLGLGTATIDLWDDNGAFARRPGIALIDPWVLATPGGRSRLQTAVKAFPEWVVLFVLADENDPGYAARGEGLFAEVVDMLSEHKVHIVKYAGHASRYLQLVRSVVTQARRQFLGKGPMPNRPVRQQPRLNNRPRPTNKTD
jgi:hypothetical protein